MKALRRYNILGIKDDVETVDERIRKRLEYDPKNYQFLVVVGGDGALLDENIKKESLKKPVLRVHYRKKSKKSLGYTADVNMKNLDKAIDDLNKGRYNLEEERLIDCFINKEYSGSAINDVAIEGVRHASNILFKTTIKTNDDYLEYLPTPKCTGAVVSKAYASPAWNLSLDGPIVLDVDLFIINFREAPMKPEHYICSGDDTILLELFDDTIVKIDRLEKTANSGSLMELKKSDKGIKFIRTENTRESLMSKILRHNKFQLEILEGSSNVNGT